LQKTLQYFNSNASVINFYKLRFATHLIQWFGVAVEKRYKNVLQQFVQFSQRFWPLQNTFALVVHAYESA
jgi:protoporphyrinogen oxidase